MASSTNTKIILAKLEDYTLWNRAFMVKAVSLDLWEYLQPEGRSKWPTPPKMPEYKDYPKKAINRQTRSQSSATIAEEEIEPDGVPRNLLEMTKEGKENYQAEWNRYIDLKRDYEIHRKHVADLTTWMSEFVSIDYKRTTFDPFKSIDEWYDKLRDSGKYLGATQQL
ncbi:hypothetical protein CHU98_g675 [Xylaria longipes]|nr:hypothetical protein CHU98_g675 [Xylaria longipes]